MSGILSFFGGAAFRMIWGEISHYLTARQEHKNEMDRMKQQEQMDAAAHARNVEVIRLHADLEIREVQVRSDAAQILEEVRAWGAVAEATTKKVGIKWIDAWNASIRPGIATWAVVALSLQELGFLTLSVLAADIACSAIGLYLADRALAKRGK